MLLNREFELASLASALRAADDGCGSLTLVAGPLGVGKSALLDEAASMGQERDALVLRASATPTERDYAVGVVRQLFEPAFRLAPAETRDRWLSGPAEPARAVLTAPCAEAGEPGSREQAEAAMHGLLSAVERISRERLPLLLLDDLHWTDAESLRWLRHLARRVSQMRVFVVCTIREGDTLAEQRRVNEVIAHASHTLTPGRLDLDATRELVRRRHGERCSERQVAALHEASNGNPLLLRALMDSEGDGGTAGGHLTAPGADGSEGPAAGRPSLLHQRLLLYFDAQPAHIRRLARALAVLGDHTPPEVLGRLAGLDPVGRNEALRLLAKADLLTGRELPEFTHALVREAVLEGTPLPERTRLHARAAELLFQEGRPAEEVAEQLMAITVSLGPWATRVLRSAAGDAMRRGEPLLAARYVRRALLDNSAHGAERGRLLTELAAAERSFAPLASVRHVSQAVTLLDSAGERAAALVRLSPFLLETTTFPVGDLLRRSAQEFDRMSQLSTEESDLTLRLEARSRYVSAGDAASLADSVARLRELGPRPPVGTVGERELLAVLLQAATVGGAATAAEVAALAGEVLDREPATPGHVHTTLPTLVTSLVAADRVEALVPWLRTAYGLSTRSAGDVERVVIRAEQAVAALACGRVATARSYAWESFERADTDYREVAGPSAIALASVAIRTGDGALTERLLGNRSRAPGDPMSGALLSMLKGGAAVRQGDPRGALDHFLEAGQRLARSDWDNPALLPWASQAALVHDRLGQHRQAVELICGEVERARAWGAPAALGRALTVQGRVTAGPAGVAQLREAVEVLRSSADRYALCQSLLALGRRLEPASAEARAAFRRAHALAADCGAPRLSETAARLLGGTSDTREANGPRLTPAELHVARLAASGQTNQAIAEELGITSRGVEKHLTSCYRKLSIRGRSALETALREVAPSDAASHSTVLP